MNDRSPSAGAMRAGRVARRTNATTEELASIIDADVQPLVNALRNLVAQVTSPDVNQSVEDVYVDEARAALAAWSG